ncbi:ATP-binding protein [Oxalobacteraceae bacterium A2-2]
MDRFNTLYARLLALVLAAMVLSHAVTFVLMVLVFHTWPGQRPPPGGIWTIAGVEFLSWAVMALAVARLVARPIQQLARAASELGDNVDRAPLAETGSQEARSAARAFNRMQARLREQIAARARFLAAVSHDLRTPLTRIRLRVERLPADGARDQLREDVEEMRQMLDATLDYLRGEARGETPVRLDVQALLESMVDDYQEQGLEVRLAGKAAPLQVQQGALRRALSNLIENALRYGGAADIELAEEEGWLRIQIRDRGPGIPEHQLEAVFEPFYRIESSRNKATGGAGLGLSIAREAILRQGGALTLANLPDGGLLAAVRVPR